MDFNYTPEDEAFRTEVRAWLEANKKFAPPPSNIMADEGAGDWEARVNWHKKLNEGGWVAVNWPKEYGGRGATVMQRLIYREELSRLGLNEPMIGMGISLLGPTLMHWGTEEQKKNHIPKILKGEEVWCQGYSEPGSGSDLASVQTRAIDDGDDFVVNGQKVWTSMAQHADMIFALVRTDPDAPKHKGISYLLIDMHSPGRHRASAGADDGWQGLQRSFLRGRARAEEKYRRRAQQRLASRDDHADVRARQRRRRRLPRRSARAGETRQANPAQRQQRVGRFERAAARRGIRGRGAGASIHRLSAVDASVEGDAAGARRLDDETVRHRAWASRLRCMRWNCSGRTASSNSTRRSQSTRASGRSGCSPRAARQSTPERIRSSTTSSASACSGLPKG